MDTYTSRALSYMTFYPLYFVIFCNEIFCIFQNPIKNVKKRRNFIIKKYLHFKVALKIFQTNFFFQKWNNLTLTLRCSEWFRLNSIIMILLSIYFCKEKIELMYQTKKSQFSLLVILNLKWWFPLCSNRVVLRAQRKYCTN